MNEGQFNPMNPEYKKVEDLGESKMREVPLLDDKKALNDLDSYLNSPNTGGGMSNEQFNQDKHREYNPLVKALPAKDQKELDMLMRRANEGNAQSNGEMILPETDKLCVNKDVVLLALTHYADDDYQMSHMVYEDKVLQFVDENLRLDKEVMIAALKKSSMNIQFYTFSEEVCDNETLFLSLVKNDGLVLEYASGKLQNDKKIVGEAVHNDSRALQFASDALRDDEDFILQLLKKEKGANYYGNAKSHIKEFMSKKLCNSKEFMEKFDEKK